MSDQFEPIADPRPVDSPWPQAVWPVPVDAVLTGTTIELRRTVPADADGICNALADPRVWEFLVMNAQTAEQWHETIAALQTAPAFCQWTVVLREEVNGLPAGTIVGTTAFLDTSAQDARTEIGFTSYNPLVWGTRVNPETKLLLLRWAFDRMLMGRVQLKTDVRNVRSQKAISRLGATYEGVRRRYQRRADGSIRDTVVFSIIAQEWPAVRDGLIQRLGGDPQA
jgi:hypothetical protein